MKILSVNAGSSSLKFQLFEMPEEKVVISGVFERIGLDNSFYTIKINGEKIKKEVNLTNHEEAVKVLIAELLGNNVIKDLSEIKGVGHRLVHGGEKYADSVVIDNDVMKTLKDLIPLAPLHNPANITGVKAFMSKIPEAKEVGCFDTAFHQTMAEEDYLYAVPYDWYTKYGVRKYGFHGMSHKYVSAKMNEILGRLDTKVITCHIGNGASISAIKDGKCLDTSMGFTPNAGLMMGSRSGDIDATMIPYVMDKSSKSLAEVMDDLNKNSGYLGVSGVSSDGRDIEDGINNGNQKCILAQKMYVKRIVDYIAMYYAELGGCDAIVFTAGVGENSSSTRHEIMAGLKAFGVTIDEEQNKKRGEVIKISGNDSNILCYVIPTNEELMIAQDTYNLIK
jgi:acetate kinase